MDDLVRRLQEKVNILTQSLDALHGTPCEQIRHQQEVEALRTALAFYADPTAYEYEYRERSCGCCSDSVKPVEEDAGQIARDALGLPDVAPSAR